jgi:hypothetical protein
MTHYRLSVLQFFRVQRVLEKLLEIDRLGINFLIFFNSKVANQWDSA